MPISEPFRDCKNRFDHKYNEITDAIILWDNEARYNNLKTMLGIWTREIGGRSAYHPCLIIHLLKKFPLKRIPEHLTLITDGYTDIAEMDQVEELIQQTGIQFKYVTFYGIGQITNLSGGCSFIRNCPSTIKIISPEHAHEIIISKSDFNLFNNLYVIKTTESFLMNFDTIFKVVFAKTIGKDRNPQLISYLSSIRDNIHTSNIEFDRKINFLIDMADRFVQNIFDYHTLFVQNIKK